MIYDTLENAVRYSGCAIHRGLALLQSYAQQPAGRYEIDGERLFVLVQQYEPKPLESSQWETHHRYLDIQYMAQGKELIGFAGAEALQVTQPYRADIDAELARGSGMLFACGAGSFMVFYPGEAHMPCVAAEVSGPVRKVIVKMQWD